MIATGQAYYSYPAIFTYEEPDSIAVEFPDLPECVTCGHDENEAYMRATEVLELCLFGREEDHEPIPEPTPISEFHLGTNQIVVLIRANMTLARMKVKNAAVKKTLTIPQWLNELAEENKINFSQVLQDALVKLLGVSYPDEGKRPVGRPKTA